MSIEIVGPQKYKFQDRVCLIVALQHAVNSMAQLEIEPRGGEDAQLVLDNDVTRQVIEIQVKGAKGKIDTDTLVDWLSHFPARKDQNPLIQRLANDPARIVMMIASGRCDDSTSVYVTSHPAPLNPWRPNTIQKADVVKIRTGFESYKNARENDGDLKKRQRASIGSILSCISERTLRDTMHRVLVIERLDEGAVHLIAENLLQIVHGIVPDLIADTLTRLEAIIFEAKGTGVDVLPAIREQIRVCRVDDVLTPTGYITRGDEEYLKNKLSTEKALLLAGRPRTGKTTTSRWLAGKFQQLGFRVKEAESVVSAQRFLMDPVHENRLALVDDPFGGAHATDDASRELLILERLLPLLAKNRRLILVQAQDRLLEVGRKRFVDGMETGGVKWIELSNLDSAFLVNIWSQACVAYSVPKWLSDFVRHALFTSEVDLEPGCLIHLAANHDKLPEGVDLKAITRLAREDAQSLGRALSAEGLKPVLMALAISTTADLPVSATELAFAMGIGGPEYPGKCKVFAKSITFGEKRMSDNIAEPQYDPVPQLTSVTEVLIDKLESRRIVEVRANGLYTFTHPFYRASSESLIDAATTLAEKSSIAMIARSLLSLSPESSDAAAKNLTWLCERLDTESGREALIEIAVDGLESIFPGTRDGCFSFLIKMLKQLPSQKQNQISKWITSVTFFNIDDVEWFRGLPRIPSGNMGGILDVDFVPTEIPRSEIEKTIQALDRAEATVILPEQAAGALRFLVRHPERLTLNSVGRLLSYDIALIRAPAAGAWLTTSHTDDDQILERIFTEEHPAVADAVLKSVLDAWEDCEPSRQLQLQHGLMTMASSPIAAVALIDRLVRFDRYEETGDNPPWALFGELMAQVLKVLPPGAAFHEARLYNVLYEARGYISAASLLCIVDHWIDLLHNSVGSRMPSDFMLGVTDVLIEGTKTAPQSRHGRVKRLLQLSGTSSRIRVVADLVQRWELLTEEERSGVLEQLSQPSQDAVWLRATAVTRNSVPKEIVDLFLPPCCLEPPKLLSKILQIPEELLNAAVQVYTGSHPAIYYIGVHGGPKKIWGSVVEHIAQLPDHQLFEIAWENLLSSGDTEELSRSVRALGAEDAPRLFEIMLARNIRTNGDFLPNAWSALFEIAADEFVKEQWLEQMADAASNVLDEIFEASRWIPESYRKRFLKYFETDLSFLRLLATIYQVIGDSDSEANAPSYTSDLLMILREFLTDQSPRHWGTYGLMMNMLRKLRIDDKCFMAELEALREKLLEERKSSFYPRQAALDGWVQF